ncbi:MAG: hypothetical protein CMK97_12050 [Pseudomonas sp.]|nr:hypothetical protein [Pseudomonas sp.]MBB51183.1 hypothetical protein [Pseudomonadales bacterium]|tara:strand:- start:9 stop:425 length:417 start_codon:yes stop_codon:yes gene_type:complete
MKWNFMLVTTLVLALSSSLASAIERGPIQLAGINAEVWGDYTVTPSLFPEESWRFYLIVVPESVRQGTLIQMAKAFYAKHPHTRARFFSNTEHLQQYVDRDIYYNDSTGTAKEVDFPDSVWVQNHHLNRPGFRGGFNS